MHIMFQKQLILKFRFRSMWERYCRGVNAIVYMVDSADSQKIEVFDFKACNLQFLDQSSEQASRTELRNLLERPQLVGIPVLVRAKTKSSCGSALSLK